MPRFRLTFALTCLLACSDPGAEESGADTAAAADVVAEGDAVPADVAAPQADADAAPEGPAEDSQSADTGPFSPAETCDPAKPPLILAHGFLASGDTWAPHGMRFMANGWCTAQLETFDWDSFQEDTTNAVAQLDAAVDALLARTGAPTAILFGHSRGGGLGYDYLADAGRAAKISKFVYVGSTKRDALPAHGTTTLNLWSSGDAVIASKGDLPGATNVQLSGDDHFGVATSEASFAAVHQFITGSEPTVTGLPSTEAVWLAGKAVYFGDNAPAVGGRLSVYPVDESGVRTGDPLFVTTIGDDARFGPFEASPGGRYEFEIADVGRTIAHYYREPATRPNPFVYVRALPGLEGGMAGAVLSAIPLDPGKAVIVAFNSSRGFLFGADTLALAAAPLLTATSASAEKTLIALFLYDGDGDAATEGSSVALFEGFPFLGARDTTLPVGGSTALSLGTRSIGVQRFDSATEGVSIAVFD